MISTKLLYSIKMVVNGRRTFRQHPDAKSALSDTLRPSPSLLPPGPGIRSENANKSENAKKAGAAVSVSALNRAHIAFQTITAAGMSAAVIFLAAIAAIVLFSTVLARAETAEEPSSPEFSFHVYGTSVFVDPMNKGEVGSSDAEIVRALNSLRDSVPRFSHLTPTENQLRDRIRQAERIIEHPQATEKDVYDAFVFKRNGVAALVRSSKLPPSAEDQANDSLRERGFARLAEYWTNILWNNRFQSAAVRGDFERVSQLIEELDGQLSNENPVSPFQAQKIGLIVQNLARLKKPDWEQTVCQRYLNLLRRPKNSQFRPFADALAGERNLNRAPGGKLDLSGRFVDGTDFSIDQFRGKAVLVRFWRVGDRSFPYEAAELSQLFEEFQPLGFEIIEISQFSNREALESFPQYKKIPGRHALNSQTAIEGQTAMERFGLTGDGGIIANRFPIGILVRTDGTVESTNTSVRNLKRVLISWLGSAKQENGAAVREAGFYSPLPTTGTAAEFLAFMDRQIRERSNIIEDSFTDSFLLDRMNTLACRVFDSPDVTEEQARKAAEHLFRLKFIGSPYNPERTKLGDKNLSVYDYLRLKGFSPLAKRLERERITPRMEDCLPDRLNQFEQLFTELETELKSEQNDERQANAEQKADASQSPDSRRTGSERQRTIAQEMFDAVVLLDKRKLNEAFQQYAQRTIEALAPFDNPEIRSIVGSLTSSRSRTRFIGQKLNLTGRYIDDQPLNLDAYRGKTTLLFLTHKSPGVHDGWYSSLQELYDQYGGQGLELLRFEMTDPGPEYLFRARGDSASWILALDSTTRLDGETLSEALGILPVPGIAGLVVLDQQGTVVAIENNLAKVRERLEAAFGPPAGPAARKPDWTIPPDATVDQLFTLIRSIRPVPSKPGPRQPTSIEWLFSPEEALEIRLNVINRILSCPQTTESQANMAALFAVQTVLPAVRNLMQQIRPGMTQERRQATERQIVRLKDQLADLIVRLKNAGFTDLERKYQWPTLGCRLEKAGRDNDRKLVQTLAGQLQATMRTLTLKEIMDKPDREQNSNMRHRILFENLYSACTAAYAFDDSDFADRIMDPALAQYRQIMGTHRDYNLDMYAARLRLDHIIGTRIPLTGRTFANRPLLLDSLRGKVVFLYLSDAPWFKEDRRTAEQYLRDALEKLYREIPHSRLEIIAVSQAEKPEDAAIVPWIQAFDSQTDLKGVPLSQYYSWQDNHPLNSNYLVGPDGRVAASSLNIREARQKIIELCDKLEQAEKIAQQEKEKETRTIRYYQTNKRHKGCCLFHKRKAVYFRFCQ